MFQVAYLPADYLKFSVLLCWLALPYYLCCLRLAALYEEIIISAITSDILIGGYLKIQRTEKTTRPNKKPSQQWDGSIIITTD